MADQRAVFPASHPLKPETWTGLHWSWQGGYIFLRGGKVCWRNANGELDGWGLPSSRGIRMRRVSTLAAPLEITNRDEGGRWIFGPWQRC